jgi:YggT family protein
MLELVCIALSLYTFVLLARIVLSWLQMTSWRPPDGLTPVIDGIYRLTEPLMGFFRGLIPPIGGLDLSPLVIFLIIAFVRRAIGC